MSHICYKFLFFPKVCIRFPSEGHINTQKNVLLNGRRTVARPFLTRVSFLICANPVRKGGGGGAGVASKVWVPAWSVPQISRVGL